MVGLLYGVVAWAASGLIPLLLVGAGMSLIVYTGMEPLINALLEDSTSKLTGMPETALQLILLTGVGEALSIMGSAILTRFAITMAMTFGGIRYTNN